MSLGMCSRRKGERGSLSYQVEAAAPGPAAAAPAAPRRSGPSLLLPCDERVCVHVRVGQTHRRRRKPRSLKYNGRVGECFGIPPRSFRLLTEERPTMKSFAPWVCQIMAGDQHQHISIIRLTLRSFAHTSSHCTGAQGPAPLFRGFLFARLVVVGTWQSLQRELSHTSGQQPRRAAWAFSGPARRHTRLRRRLSKRKRCAHGGWMGSRLLCPHALPPQLFFWEPRPRRRSVSRSMQ